MLSVVLMPLHKLARTTDTLSQGFRSLAALRGLCALKIGSQGRNMSNDRPAVRAALFSGIGYKVRFRAHIPEAERLLLPGTLLDARTRYQPIVAHPLKH